MKPSSVLTRLALSFMFFVALFDLTAQTRPHVPWALYDPERLVVYSYVTGLTQFPIIASSYPKIDTTSGYIRYTAPTYFNDNFPIYRTIMTLGFHRGAFGDSLIDFGQGKWMMANDTVIFKLDLNSISNQVTNGFIGPYRRSVEPIDNQTMDSVKYYDLNGFDLIVSKRYGIVKYRATQRYSKQTRPTFRSIFDRRRYHRITYFSYIPNMATYF